MLVGFKFFLILFFFKKVDVIGYVFIFYFLGDLISN